MQEAVLPQLNEFRPCAAVRADLAVQRHAEHAGPDWRFLLFKRLTVAGFIVSDHMADMGGFWKDVPPAVKAGKIKYREDVVKGIENAPEAFMGLLKGRNFGKMLVQVSDDPTRK